MCLEAAWREAQMDANSTYMEIDHSPCPQLQNEQLKENPLKT